MAKNKAVTKSLTENDVLDKILNDYQTMYADFCKLFLGKVDHADAKIKESWDRVLDLEKSMTKTMAELEQLVTKTNAQANKKICIKIGFSLLEYNLYTQIGLTAKSEYLLYAELKFLEACKLLEEMFGEIELNNAFNRKEPEVKKFVSNLLLQRVVFFDLLKHLQNNPIVSHQYLVKLLLLLYKNCEDSILRLNMVFHFIHNEIFYKLQPEEHLKEFYKDYFMIHHNMTYKLGNSTTTNETILKAARKKGKLKIATEDLLARLELNSWAMCVKAPKMYDLIVAEVKEKTYETLLTYWQNYLQFKTHFFILVPKLKELMCPINQYLGSVHCERVTYYLYHLLESLNSCSQQHKDFIELVKKLEPIDMQKNEKGLLFRVTNEQAFLAENQQAVGELVKQFLKARKRHVDLKFFKEELAKSKEKAVVLKTNIDEKTNKENEEARMRGDKLVAEESKERDRKITTKLSNKLIILNKTTDSEETRSLEEEHKETVVANNKETIPQELQNLGNQESEALSLACTLSLQTFELYQLVKSRHENKGRNVHFTVQEQNRINIILNIHFSNFNRWIELCKTLFQNYKENKHSSAKVGIEWSKDDLVNFVKIINDNMGKTIEYFEDIIRDVVGEKPMQTILRDIGEKEATLQYENPQLLSDKEIIVLGKNKLDELKQQRQLQKKPKTALSLEVSFLKKLDISACKKTHKNLEYCLTLIEGEAQKNTYAFFQEKSDQKEIIKNQNHEFKF